MPLIAHLLPDRQGPEHAEDAGEPLHLDAGGGVEVGQEPAEGRQQGRHRAVQPVDAGDDGGRPGVGHAQDAREGDVLAVVTQGCSHEP